jgi:hypothetical protein
MSDAQPICRKCDEYIFQGGDSGPIETIYYDQNLDTLCAHYLHRGRFFIDYGGIIFVFDDRDLYGQKLKSLDFIALLD